MNLKILLPDRIFLDKTEVIRIVAESRGGSFGLLPRRLDCVVALVPGILVYQTPGSGEVCVAVDEGVLVKAGDEVRVAARRAIGGADLGALRAAVEKDFLVLDAEEKSMQSVLAKIEGGFVRRLAAFHHE